MRGVLCGIQPPLTQMPGLRKQRREPCSEWTLLASPDAGSVVNFFSDCRCVRVYREECCRSELDMPCGRRARAQQKNGPGFTTGGRAREASGVKASCRACANLDARGMALPAGGESIWNRRVRTFSVSNISKVWKLSSSSRCLRYDSLTSFFLRSRLFLVCAA